MNLTLSWFARWLARRGDRRYRTGAKRGGPAPEDPNQGMLLTEARAEARGSGGGPP